jgi:ribosomal protein S18 acetylase RimI-like enzyme
VGRSDTLAEIAKKVQRDPDLFLVAETGGKLIGSVIGGFDGRRGMIYHLAVAEEYRQQGLGAALMDEVERRLKAKGCVKSYLLVVDGNEAAARFYKKLGWQEMDVTILGKEL